MEITDGERELNDWMKDLRAADPEAGAGMLLNQPLVDADAARKAAARMRRELEMEDEDVAYFLGGMSLREDRLADRADGE